MISAFVKGVDQLSDKATRRYVWMSLGLALAVFVVLWTGLGYLLTNTAFFTAGWLEGAVDLLGGLAVAALTFILFPAVTSAFIGLFLDGVADAVEARHYPDLEPAPGQSVAEATVTAVKFLVIMAVLNLLLLPFLIIPPLFPFVFYGVNGYLLGREYFEVVAHRRLGGSEARSLRKSRSKRVFLAGVVIALLLTIPVVNLLAPVIGTAAMVHLVEGWRSRRAPAETGATA